MYRWIIATLLIAVAGGGCGGGGKTLTGNAPVGGKVVTDCPTTVAPFSELSEMTAGSKLKLRVNRSGFEVREYLVILDGTTTNWGEQLLTCHATGELIIGAGDSGSPVLTQDGRIAGVLCYGVPGDFKFFQARAIEDVIAIGGRSSVAPSISAGVQPIKPAFYISAPNASRLKGKLDGFYLSGTHLPSAGTGGMSPASAATVIPGMSISVDLASGDIVRIGAVGTASYVTSSKVLAFGHEFLRGGEDYQIPVTLARMLSMVAVPDLWAGSFKVSDPTNVSVGAMNNDRFQGISIAREASAETFPATVHVDVNGVAARTFTHQIARLGGSDNELVAMSAALWLPTDLTFNKISGGTVTGTLGLQIDGEEPVYLQLGYGDLGLISPDDITDALWQNIFELIEASKINGKSFTKAELWVDISDTMPPDSKWGG